MNLTATEKLVIRAIKSGEWRLLYCKNRKMTRMARCDKAIMSLREKGIINKGKDDILKIV